MLLDELRRRQEAIGDSDTQFARRLGMPRETWQKIRTGERMPGRKGLHCIVVAYPDLFKLVMGYVSGSNGAKL